MSCEHNVMISGLTASGKTTHCHLLSGEFGLSYMSSSQVLLARNRMNPIQSRDFWLSDTARKIWQGPAMAEVERTLLMQESNGVETVFDTLAMPWIHRRPAMNIWLESSVESRLMKCLVSHRKFHERPSLELEAAIREKDETARSYFKEAYDFDIFLDRSPFDLILDISDCIVETTWESCLKSIAEVHSIIRPVVGWYLTGIPAFQSEFRSAVASASSCRVLRLPGEGASD